MKTRKLDLTEKVADWVDCERCNGAGCSDCNWQGSFLRPRQNYN